MAFDAIETVMEDNRLARRLSGTDMKPLSLDAKLKPPGDPQIVEMLKQLRRKPLKHLLSQPMGRYQFLIFLKYRAPSAPHHNLLLFVEDVQKYRLADESTRRAEARQLKRRYLSPADVENSRSMFPDKNSAATNPRTSSGTGLDQKEADVRGAESLLPGAPGSPESPRAAGAKRVPATDEELQRINEGLANPDPGQELYDELAMVCNAKLENFYEQYFLPSDDFTKYAQYIIYCEQAGDRLSLSSFVKFRVVGKGAFGAVSAVSQVETSAVYAMKEMSKRQIKAQDVFNVARNERDILAKLSSHFVTQLKYCLQDESSVYFLMDFASGGDLKWHIRNRAAKDPINGRFHFTQTETRFYAAEVLLALEHCHSLGIAYRDLKPHNILLNNDGHCMLSDFGLAQELSETKDGTMTSLSGTPGFWAPQVMMRKPYGLECDVWSWGVCLYYFLIGSKPKCTCTKDQWCTFIHKDEEEQEQLAKERGLKAYNSKIQLPQELGAEARDLLEKVFEVDRNKRYTWAQIKDHVYFTGMNWKRLANRGLDPPWKPGHSDVHADSLAAVGNLDNYKYRKVELSAEDEEQFNDFNFYDPLIFQQEVASALIRQYKRFGEHPEQKYEEEQLELAKERNDDECCLIL